MSDSAQGLIGHLLGALAAIISLVANPLQPTPAQASDQEQAYRGSVFHILKDPSRHSENAYEYIEDALLVVKDGHIKKLAPYHSERSKLTPGTTVSDYSGMLIMPGFIDTHIHYPQREMIAAYGKQLLEWLNTYTFPTEKKYSDAAYARSQADLFLEELIRNGTTTALVFTTVYPISVEALFEAAYTKNMRIIAGKVLMDRNAPIELIDTPKSGIDQSRALIRKWHGKGRLAYAITPRFAITSSPEQLQAAGTLKKEFPTIYVHTHLSENTDEIALVKKFFPERSSYFDVYDYYGLTGPRSVFAHGVHLSESEINRIKQTKSVISFCPTSNLFLGSGLFPYRALKDKGVRVALGTDVGAGTSFSLFETLNEAYKVNQLNKTSFSPIEGLYLATLGGAKALELDNKIGNFLAGKEADFIVINPNSTPILQARSKNSKNLEEKLFALMMLSDDRSIKAVYIAGKKVETQSRKASP